MILEKLKNQLIFFDGGLGTLLQEKGLSIGEYPEKWNITHPKILEEIHSEYIKAGANIISANTFGANSLKFEEAELEEIIVSAIKIAKRAAPENCSVALDIGPLGQLIKPLGSLDFEDAIDIFAKTIKIGVKAGADLILFETFTDIYELKAAIIAAKENSSLPIFATVAFEANGRLMTGANVGAVVTLLESLKVDALGINCSLGPDSMLEIANEFVNLSSIPVIVNPNAGLPEIVDTKTKFNVGPEEFAKSMLKVADIGVRGLGGCCGTTPEHISALVNTLKDYKIKEIKNKDLTVISSYTHANTFNSKPVLIGERLNPTGKKALKKALIENNLKYILTQAIDQEKQGANSLDVNVGLPELNEETVLPEIIKSIQSVTNLPLTIDTSNLKAMEKAIRVYNGKPLLNSVNGKKESMQSVFSIMQKYGGAVIALTLDEKGIPDTAKERVQIALKIIKVAKQFGISKNDIIVDPLAMAVSAKPDSANVALESIKELTKLGIKTSLGVSNVSFGLPNRDTLTATFFALALENGLSAAILNPGSAQMQQTYYSYCALKGLDSNFNDYINFSQNSGISASKQETVANSTYTLGESIIKGLQANAKEAALKALEEMDAMKVINEKIIPALDTVGKGFENNTIYLPQLLLSARAATAAFEVVKSKFDNNKTQEIKKTILLATVHGDIHDIGKNIVKVLLENYGFNVIDLGKDVPPQLILESAIKNNVDIVGLSALMTTTVSNMEKTIKILKGNSFKGKIIVGGAVLTADYSQKIGADFYCKDAMDTVRYCENLK